MSKTARSASRHLRQLMLAGMALRQRHGKFMETDAMDLLEVRIMETVQIVPLDLVERDLPETVSTPAAKAVVQRVDERELEAAQRELRSLQEQQFLCADDTKRLRKLADMLGKRVQLQRHHFGRDETETFILP